MEDHKSFEFIPKEKVKAYDGMAVTADVWEKTQQEHRDAMRAHLILSHHSGIITGLEVTANEPSDHFVFISPGVAIDSSGQMIVVDQTVAYDFGSEGGQTLILFLGYGERETGGSDSSMRVTKSEYMIGARSSWPKKPVVEIARIKLSAKNISIKNAADSLVPLENEIDLRFRENANDRRKLVRAAVINVGDNKSDQSLSWHQMLNFLKYLPEYQLAVDINAEWNDISTDFNFLHICISEAKEIPDEAFQTVKSLLKAGGGIFIEAVTPEGVSAAQKLGEKLGVANNPNVYSDYYEKPFLFRVPPTGIDPKKIFTNGQVFVSLDPVSDLWSGMKNGTAVDRGTIRTSLEWGSNIIYNCLG